MNTSLPVDHATRLARAQLALDGLSVGDALGETCFHPDNWDAILEDPFATARAPWEWTDDTAMALAIYEVLAAHGHIEQDALATRFAERHQAEPLRGYGAGAHRLLDQVARGTPWQTAAEGVFPGGSYGNGSAMRIAALAAYFAADDSATLSEQARLSAEVTHAHPEGIAGAIAVAVAGAYAWKHGDRCSAMETKRTLFDVVLAHTPLSEVRTGIERAATIDFQPPSEPTPRLLDYGTSTVPFDISFEPIVRQLGNGSRICCQDTVPFCIWAAARYLDNYRDAIVNTIRAHGDIDTNCAIVGGIVSLAVGRSGIPEPWLSSREPLGI